MTHLFERPVPETGEVFEVLARNDRLTVELIVSSDTPEPLLYDQDHDEAVVLLEGGATLWVDGEEIEMGPGDYLCLPAHTPHKVLATRKGTRWLAIHAKEPLC